MKIDTRLGMTDEEWEAIERLFKREDGTTDYGKVIPLGPPPKIQDFGLGEAAARKLDTLIKRRVKG